MSWGARGVVAAVAMVAALLITVAEAPIASADEGTATFETVVVSNPDDGFCTHYELRYTAGAEANNVTIGGDVQFDPPRDEPYCPETGADIVVIDSGASIESGAGCEGTAYVGTCSAPVFDRAVISTGEGDDSIRVGPMPIKGATYISAGAGNDAIRALNGHRDGIWCGSGHDVVIADATDQIASDCEVVQFQA